MTIKKQLLPKKELIQFQDWVKKNGGGYKEYLAATRLEMGK